MQNKLQLNTSFISILIFTLSLLIGRFLNVSFFEFSGPYYSLGITSVWLLLIIYLLKMNKIFLSLDIIIFSGFILICLISLLNANPSEYSIRKIYEIMFYIFPMLLVTKYIFNNRKDFRTFFTISYYISLFLCTIAIILSLLDGTLLSGRLSAFGGGPITFSRILMLGLLSGILIFYEAHKQKITLKYIRILPLVLLATSIALTGSRQSFLALILCLLLFGFFVFNLSSFSGKVKGVFGFFMMFTVLLISLAMIFDKIIKQSPIYNRTKLIFQKDKGESINIRFEMLQTSFVHFKENWHLGTGLGTFENYNNAGFLYPHNIFAEIAIEVGILGVLCLGILISVPFIIVINNLLLKKQKDVYIYGLFTIYIYFLITAMISGDFFDNRWLWIIVSLIMIYKARITNEVEN